MTVRAHQSRLARPVARIRTSPTGCAWPDALIRMHPTGRARPDETLHPQRGVCSRASAAALPVRGVCDSSAAAAHPVRGARSGSAAAAHPSGPSAAARPQRHARPAHRPGRQAERAAGSPRAVDAHVHLLSKQHVHGATTRPAAPGGARVSPSGLRALWR